MLKIIKRPENGLNSGKVITLFQTLPGNTNTKLVSPK